ncbi:MAG: NAD+ synthase [Elusimicrobia bacterium]|nr:NAD+ synthase [Elusimicrobiota bacterium]
MRVALAQLDPVVGDVRGNLERVRAAYKAAVAQGAELVMTPELALAGYPPRDLLEQPDFVRANRQALAALAKQTRAAGLLVGFVEANPAPRGRAVFNSAALLHQGKVTATRRKTLLPTYDVFDEVRHFEPARENAPVRFKGRRLGITICEDAWNDEAFWGKRLYQDDPVARQVKAGAELLLNVSASPFETGKLAFRRGIVAGHARRHGLPFLYCAQVGGNDELVFDGYSFAVDARGRTLAAGRGFAEDLIMVDTDAPGRASFPERPPVADLHDALVLGIRDYAAKCSFKSALIGLSGGIDSAVTCALAAAALGPEKVLGVSMPSMYSSPGSVSDAEALAVNLGARLISLPIKGPYDALMRALAGPFKGTASGLPEQNLQARIRGNLLMALSNKSGSLLLSTGNKSELAVGYCTLYGDMSGGLAAIADVFKTDVYALARYMNRERAVIPQDSIDKAPSAELKPDQKDQDDLPPYDQLDRILRLYIEEGKDAAAIVKTGEPAALVRDLLDRVDRAEYKRRQAPPVLRVSPKAFGVGRRMPIARGPHR